MMQKSLQKEPAAHIVAVNDICAGSFEAVSVTSGKIMLLQNYVDEGGLQTKRRSNTFYELRVPNDGTPEQLNRISIMNPEKLPRRRL